MLSDLLGVLKFATDPNTRETIRAISNVASSKQTDWRKSIQRMSSEFRPSNWASVNVFTNELFRKVSETGISDSKLQRFTTIYSELVNNAYQHGIRGIQNWRISVNCIYSRWFIQLDVADSGMGFNLELIYRKIEFERTEGKRQGKSGLELVRELADTIHVDGKKSRITVVIAGEDRIKIESTVEPLEEHQLLVVTWADNADWSFLLPNWEPLRDVLDRANKSLVLVRFGGETYRELELKEAARRVHSTSITTESGRLAKSVIFECALDKHHLFAYVVPQRWIYDIWKEDETDNLHFFRNELDARQWLIQQSAQVKSLDLKKTGSSKTAHDSIKPIILSKDAKTPKSAKPRRRA